MTTSPREVTEKRPQSNCAQIVSAGASTIALVLGGFSLYIAYSSYTNTQSIAVNNYIAAQKRETDRRVRDTYTKLYDKDVELWKSIVQYPILHQLIFNDAYGLLYSSQDNDTKNRASCAFQILADLFEYYFLIKKDLTSPEWDNRKDCWADYFNYTVGSSYGFRKYIRTYEKEWTVEFKVQFNKLLSEKPIFESQLALQPDTEAAQTFENKIKKEKQTQASIISISEPEGKTNNSWIFSFVGALSYLYTFPIGAIVGASIPWVIALYTNKSRIDIQRKIETAKLLTEINKATISNQMLTLFWDKYRTKQIYLGIKAKSSSTEITEKSLQDSATAMQTEIGVFPGIRGGGNDLDTADYFSIRNFAYFKLNLFELTHDAGIDGMKSGSWKGYLLYSLRHSAFMREIATESDRTKFYSNSFCSLLDSCLNQTFIEGILDNLERMMPILPEKVVDYLSKVSSQGTSSLLDEYNKIQAKLMKSDEREKFKESCKRYCDLNPPSSKVKNRVSLYRQDETLPESNISGDLLTVIDIFHMICNIRNRWERHVLLDSLYPSVSEIEEITLPPPKN